MKDLFSGFIDFTKRWNRNDNGFGPFLPKDQSRDQEKKRNVSGENVLGYIMPQPLELLNMDQR